MNGWSALNRFLQTDPRDAGCEQAMEMLHLRRAGGRRRPGGAALPGHRGALAQLRPVRGGLRRAAGHHPRLALTVTHCCPRQWPDRNHFPLGSSLG